MQSSKWVFLGFGALCILVVACVLNQEHLYYMSTTLIALPVVSYVLGRFTLSGLEFSREMPLVCSEGDAGQLSYAVTNRSRVPRYFVSINDDLPFWIAQDESGPPVFNLKASGVSHVTQHVEFRRRGVYSVEGFNATAVDPLGIFVFSKNVESPSEFVVYPRIRPLGALPFTGYSQTNAVELFTAAIRGDSVEPDGVRPYTPGDRLRRIHWRQTARTGKLSVLEFMDPVSVKLMVALDLRKGSVRGVDTETSLEYLIRFAASVCSSSVDSGTEVGLLLPENTTIGFDTSLVRSGSGSTHLFRILEALARAEATSSQFVSEWLGDQIGHSWFGATLLALVADVDDDLPSALAALELGGTHVTLVCVNGRSFDMQQRCDPSDSMLKGLLSVRSLGIQTFLLNWNANGDLIPEAI